MFEFLIRVIFGSYMLYELIYVHITCHSILQEDGEDGEERPDLDGFLIGHAPVPET